MVVRAETEKVRKFVGPVMRTPKRPDMGRLGIRTAYAFENRAADLALMPVKRLHTAAESGVSYDSNDGRCCARCRPSAALRVSTNLIARDTTSAFLPSNQPKSADQVSIPARFP